MPDDAKLGLVAGVAAVILGAVVYSPKVAPTPPAPAARTEQVATPTASVPVTLGPPIAPREAMAVSLSR